MAKGKRVTGGKKKKSGTASSTQSKPKGVIKEIPARKKAAPIRNDESDDEAPPTTQVESPEVPEASTMPPPSSSKTTASTPVETLSNELDMADPTYKENELELSKANAIKNNPEGVLVAESCLKENWRRLGGYVGFTPKKLTELVFAESYVTLWCDFQTARAANFGLRGGGARLSDIKVEGFFRLLTSTDASTQQEIKRVCRKAKKVSLDDPAFPKTEHRREPVRDLYVVFLCHKILKYWARERGWPEQDRVNKTTAENAVFGHSMEDWNRAIMFVKATYRKHFGSKSVGQMRDYLAKGEGTRRHGKPQRCTYLTVEEARGDKDTSRDFAQPVEHTIRQLLELNETNIEIDDGDVAELDLAAATKIIAGEDVDGRKETVFTAFDDSVQTLMSRARDDIREVMPAGLVAKFLKEQGEKVTVTHESMSGDAVFDDETKALEIQQVDNTPSAHVQVLNRPDDSAEDKAFRILHSSLGSMSAQYPTYDEACDLLHFTPEQKLTRKQVLGPLIAGMTEPPVSFSPTPIQVMSTAWMLQQDKIGAGILGLGCGLGKTTTTLWAIERLAQQAEAAVALGEERHWRPTMVTVPPSVAPGWFTEADRWYSGRLIVKLFHGNPSDNLSPARKAATLPSNVFEAIKEIKSMYPAGDVRYSRVVIVTTYNTLRERSLKEISVAEYEELMERSQEPQLDSEDDAQESSKPTDSASKLRELLQQPLPEDIRHRQELVDASYVVLEEDETVKQHRKVSVSAFRHMFDRLIMDEGHIVKSPKSALHKACHRLYAPSKWIISATPASNRVEDYVGILNMLWNPEWSVDTTMCAPEEPYSEEFGSRYLSAHPEYARKFGGRRLWLLNPRNFDSLVNQNILVDATARIVLTAIASELILRIPSTFEFLINGKPWSMAQDIKSYRVTTVELEHTRMNQRTYKNAFTKIVPALTKKKKGAELEASGFPSTTGMRAAGIHRHLNIMTTDLRLCDLNSRVASSAQTPARIRKWAEESKDSGASRYFKLTRLDPTIAPPSLREELAAYICAKSPKLQYLCRLLSRHVIEEKNKIIIWYNYPVECFAIQVLLDCLSLPCHFIGSAVSLPDRATIIEQMNDPEHPTQILLASADTLGFGVNLHEACHIEVMMSMAPNINTHVQMVGRVHRIGQKHTQLIYILTVNRTYDQIVSAKTCKKALIQILGEAQLDQLSIDPDEMDRIRSEIVAQGDMNDDAAINEFHRSIVDADFRTKADGKLMALLGLRCSRLDWDTADLDFPWRNDDSGARNPQTPTRLERHTQALYSARREKQLAQDRKDAAKEERAIEKARKAKARAEKRKERELRKAEKAAEKATEKALKKQSGHKSSERVTLSDDESDVSLSDAATVTEPEADDSDGSVTESSLDASAGEESADEASDDDGSGGDDDEDSGNESDVDMQSESGISRAEDHGSELSEPDESAPTSSTSNNVTRTVASMDAMDIDSEALAEPTPPPSFAAPQGTPTPAARPSSRAARSAPLSRQVSSVTAEDQSPANSSLPVSESNDAAPSGHTATGLKRRNYSNSPAPNKRVRTGSQVAVTAAATRPRRNKDSQKK